MKFLTAGLILVSVTAFAEELSKPSIVRVEAQGGAWKLTRNGQPYVIKGTCNHQDHAGVGAALPDRLQYFRIARLKEMGCNGYRTSHNPPTPELLEACDRLGMIVMDENRLLGSDAANIDRLTRLIRRDRNHPSVVLWSIGNEIPEMGKADGRAETARLAGFCHREDPTRPVTAACNAPKGSADGPASELDVFGINYHPEYYADARGKLTLLASETSSTATAVWGSRPSDDR